MDIFGITKSMGTSQESIRVQEEASMERRKENNGFFLSIW